MAEVDKTDGEFWYDKWVAAVNVMLAQTNEMRRLRDALKAILKEASFNKEQEDGYCDFLIDKFFMLDGEVAETIREIIGA